MSSVAKIVRFFQLALFERRLHQIIRPVCLAADGEREDEQGKKQNSVELQLVAREVRQPACIHELRKIGDVERLND